MWILSYASRFLLSKPGMSSIPSSVDHSLFTLQFESQLPPPLGTLSLPHPQAWIQNTCLVWSMLYLSLAYLLLHCTEMMIWELPKGRENVVALCILRHPAQSL